MPRAGGCCCSYLLFGLALALASRHRWPRPTSVHQPSQTTTAVCAVVSRCQCQRQTDQPKRTTAPTCPQQAEPVFITPWTYLDPASRRPLDRRSTAAAELVPGAPCRFYGTSTTTRVDLTGQLLPYKQNSIFLVSREKHACDLESPRHGMYTAQKEKFTGNSLCWMYLFVCVCICCAAQKIRVGSVP